MKINFANFKSLLSLTDYFRTEKQCKQAIVEARWEEGDIVCPHCGSRNCTKRKDSQFRCKDCRCNFSCLVGTIFENTKLSLRKWFMAMYLISSHKKGVSSHQLARDLEITQKTAWYMLQKIRTLMPQDDSVALEGDVELDEVYIGGKEKWKHKSMRTPNTQGRSTKTKTPVFGMMERTTIENEKGEEEPFSIVRAMVVERTDGATLLPIIRQFIADGSHLITDELSSYNSLEREGYNHEVVNHGGEEYVRGNLFTNTMESFWSHFRRMIVGCYHHLSDEHLQSYIDEAVYRWNTRKASQTERFSDMFNASIGNVVRQSELRLCEVA